MKKLLCRRKWKNKNKEDREGIQNGNFSERKIPLYCEEEKRKFIQIYYYTNDMEKNFKYFWTLKKKKETSKDAALQRPQGFAFSEEAI